MFAVSRDGEKVFLHQPDAGMVVPVLLDLENKKLTVRVPSVDELENDYAVYDELSEMLQALDHIHRDRVDFARKFSQECSKALRNQLSTGKLTVSAMRGFVENQIRHAGTFQSKAAPSEASTPMAVAFARALSAD